MTYEAQNGVTIGAAEKFLTQHYIRSQGTPSVTKLAVELEWMTADHRADPTTGSMMRSPIVRGSPYTSMIYDNATPRLYTERPLRSISIDKGLGGKELICGEGKGNFSVQSVEVTRELRFEFEEADMTWVLFLSEPMSFSCSQYDSRKDSWELPPLPPGVVPTITNPSYFDLVATKPVRQGMVRLAMVNNCTSGQNRLYCGSNMHGVNQQAYEDLIRDHADVYPTAKADMEFTFPVQSQEEQETRLIFNWHAARMSDLAETTDDDKINKVPGDNRQKPSIELLTFALPHHQERMKQTTSSSNKVINCDGCCLPTIHGVACPALGGTWSLVENLHRTSFFSERTPRIEMVSDLHASLMKDLTFRMPPNYLIGAGDTYFSGKLLARMARVLLIAEEQGFVTSQPELFSTALSNLQQGVEIWINGSAESPLLYDHSWGGIVMCGCNYHWNEETKEGHCLNYLDDNANNPSVPKGTVHENCPALSDAGQNFGAGFYNDHHYHFGYHIYAAAVAGRYDAMWMKRWNEHVLLFVRDIANPSDEDPYFPTWRHKDWYVGFSWASGVVTIGGRPYPNGRNQESVSEAIAAYEAIALLGETLSTTYAGSSDRDEMNRYDSALRMREMGRLLMATEIRAAKTYWHVQRPDTADVWRIYPEVYAPKIVGMIWSMLAQEQTWFGNEVWKSFGIQLMPITVATELRDDPLWLTEMLPQLMESCGPDPICVKEGWSVVVFASLSAIGHWKVAWRGVNALPDEIFNSAGANGHSRSNSLWYIATRPSVGDVSDTDASDTDVDRIAVREQMLTWGLSDSTVVPVSQA